MTDNKTSIHFSTLFARLIFWCIAIVVTCIFILTIIAILLEKRISQRASLAIEANLNVPISFQNPSFSLIKGFPGATLTLNDIIINSNDSLSQIPLLKAEKLKLQCSIFDIILGDYDFHTIILENAFLELNRNTAGKSNFHIFKSQSKSASSSFNLKNIQFKNTDINYQDHTTNSQLKIKAQDLIFKNPTTALASRADYIAQELDEVYYQLQGSSFIEVFSVKGSTVLVNNDFAPQLTAIYNTQDDMFEFQYSNFMLNGSNFTIEGVFGIIFDENYTNEIAGLYLDTKVNSQELKFNSLIGLLPIKDKTKLNNWTSNHRAQLKFTSSGNLMKELNPVHELAIQLYDAKIQHAKVSTPFSKLNLDLHYISEAKNNSLPTLSIRQFDAQIAKHKFSFNFQRIGSQNPYITFSGFADLPFNSIAPFIQDSLEHAAGLIQIDSFYFEGYRDEFLSGKEDKIKAYCKTNLKDIQFHYHNAPVLFEKGTFILEKQTLDILDWTIQMDNTNFNIKGKVGNTLANFLHKKGQKRIAPILFNIAAIGEALDIDNIQDHLLPLFFKHTESISYLPIDNIQGKLNIQINAVNRNKINIQNAKAQLFFNNEEILVQEASADWAKGNILLIGSLSMQNNVQYELLAQLKDINFGQWLQENYNFGQNYLTHEQLIGSIQGTIYSSGAWNKNKEWLSKDFTLYSDLKVAEGFLQSYKPFTSIGQALKIEDFKKIKIIDAYLQTYIEKEQIYFPQILLRSDGYNMLMNGTYSFNHQMNLKFKFNTASVLLKNIQMHNTIPSPIKTYIPEMYNFYMQAQGNVQDQNIQINYHSPFSIEKNLVMDREKLLGQYFAQFNKQIGKVLEKTKTHRNSIDFPLQSIEAPAAWNNLSELN